MNEINPLHDSPTRVATYFPDFPKTIGSSSPHRTGIVDHSLEPWQEKTLSMNIPRLAAIRRRETPLTPMPSYAFLDGYAALIHLLSWIRAGYPEKPVF
jgi:hypothetical protein